MSCGKVIFLYSASGYAEQPFLEAGYECWSYDGQNVREDKGNWHKRHAWFSYEDLEGQADKILAEVGEGVNLVVAFPPCDDLAISGACRFAEKRAKNPDFQSQATALAQLAEVVGVKANCPWMAENPISVLATTWRAPDHKFNPYDYGGYLPEDDVHPEYPDILPPRDAYPKKTRLWVGNGFVMPEKLPVAIPTHPDGSHKYADMYQKLGGKSARTKRIRSATPRGFSKALCITLQKMC